MDACVHGCMDACVRLQVAMITGLLMPTSGDCFIDGISMVTDPHESRASLGICPQQNVLLPHLGVEEHLSLLAAIKGVPARECLAAAREAAQVSGVP